MSLRVQTLNSLEQQQNWQAFKYTGENIKRDEHFVLSTIEQFKTTQQGDLPGIAAYGSLLLDHVPQDMKQLERVRKAAGM